MYGKTNCMHSEAIDTGASQGLRANFSASSGAVNRRRCIQAPSGLRWQAVSDVTKMRLNVTSNLSYMEVYAHLFNEFGGDSAQGTNKAWLRGLDHPLVVDGGFADAPRGIGRTILAVPVDVADLGCRSNVNDVQLARRAGTLTRLLPAGVQL